MPRVLIIKTGRFETFRFAEVREPSLGDVLRSTVLLHLFSGCSVTWLTSPAAVPLISGIPEVHQIVTDDAPDFDLLEKHDILINLEKDPLWIQWTRNSRISVKHGYIGNPADVTCHDSNKTPWQARLFSLLGKTWHDEKYLLSPQFFTPPTVEVGLNWKVGPNWPTKLWAESKWQQLSATLSKNYSVSWQQGFDNVAEYIKWIASCKSLITIDSLGLHLALALEKPVLVLFGATPDWEIPLYGLGRVVLPSPDRYSCMPCLKASCPEKPHCMDSISVDDAYRQFNILRREHGLSA